MPPAGLLTKEQLEVLQKTPANFQYYMILEKGYTCNKVIVQAAVLKPGSNSSATAGNTSELLMLRKRETHPEEEAANLNPTHPSAGQFALPGGNVREADRSIQEVLLRQVTEATGLSVKSIFMQLGDVTFETPIDYSREDTGAVVKHSVLVSYVVEVESAPPDGRLKFNQDAYSEAAWVSRATLHTFPMGIRTYSVVQNALEALESLDHEG